MASTRKSENDCKCQLQATAGCPGPQNREYPHGGFCLQRPWLKLGFNSVLEPTLPIVMSQEERSRSFGILGAMFGLGFICSPILGGCSVHTDFGFLVLRLPVSVS